MVEVVLITAQEVPGLGVPFQGVGRGLKVSLLESLRVGKELLQFGWSLTRFPDT